MMTIESIAAIFIGALGFVLMPFLYIWRKLEGRVDLLETKMESKVTDAEVRQILSDKLDPISEDLHEIKQRVSQLIDIVIIERRNNHKL